MKKLFQAAVAAVAAIRFMAAHALRTGHARARAALDALASCPPPDDGRAPYSTSFLTATRGLPRATPRKAGAAAGGLQTLLAAIRDLVRRACAATPSCTPRTRRQRPHTVRPALPRAMAL